MDGVVLVFRDVTERRRVEARIAEEARRKDEFLAMLAHELRNPLAAVSNAAQLLVRPAAEDVHGWSREVIERQVRQLTRLVDDLLDISRISRGNIQLKPQPVDLAAVIHSAVQVIRPLVDYRAHELRLTLSDEPLEIEADPVRLEQVIVNLLNNSAKYTEGRSDRTGARPRGRPRERYRHRNRARAAAVRVRHVHPGDRALTRAGGGLGIGLTMVQKLVEMHGGQVDVRSDGLGLGSVFTVRLPVRTDPALRRSASVPSEPARLLSPGETA